MWPFIRVHNLLYFDQSSRLLEHGDYRRNNDFIKYVFAVVGEVERSDEVEESGIEDE